MWSCDGVGASGDSQGHARPQDSGGADAWRWSGEGDGALIRMVLSLSRLPIL